MNRTIFFRYRLHLAICWLLLFALWYFLRSGDYANAGTTFYVTLIKVIDLAFLVCVCNYILIPKLLYNKKYAWFIISFITIVIVSSLVKMNLLGRLLNNNFLLDWSSGWKLKIYDNIIPHFFLVIAGAAIKLMIDHTALQKRMANMAKEKSEAELEFLKQQINPHFLFNSLNTVYFLIDKENVAARDTLHQFSEMLRYQLYETKGAAIPIEKEMKYLQDYIALQKMRKDDHYAINVTISPGVKGFLIEPFLLIPFVENCFKHISHHSDQQNVININIDYNETIFYFNAINSTVENSTDINRTGIGLANVQRRLQLLYPGKHQLIIKEANGNYDLQLQLKIKEHG